MFAFGMLFPVVFVLLFIMAIRAIVTTAWAPSKVSREPCCEVCRYRVAGLSTFTCPECGTDLRSTGIVTLPMEVRRRGSLFAAIVGWSYVMCIVGGVGGWAIAMIDFVPRMTSAMTSSMVTTTPLTPASGAYSRIDATESVNYGSGASSASNFALVLKSGATWKLSFLPLSAGYIVTGPDGMAATTSPDDGKAADTLFAAAGLDLTDAKIAAESRELSIITSILAASPYTSVSTMRLRTLTPGTPSMVGGPAAAVTGSGLFESAMVFLVSGVIWLAILVAGIIFLVARRRKLLRQFPTVRQPAPAAPTAPAPGDAPQVPPQAPKDA